MRDPLHPPVESLDLATILAALSDPTRLAILVRIADSAGEVRCGGFGDMGTKSNLSYHLAKMREAGLVNTRNEGTSRYMSLRRDDLERLFPGLLDQLIASARSTVKSDVTLPDDAGVGASN
ncbi:ArsR/SmtB family transcription factor [Microvirga puerhi]|uniref:Helix-turn-helix domain-containing protein n=1 Tax=Microvirga puerhi TaxID=2876078 RepID=A0ABS7VL93_9HYPH|nr:metalloregulator ArsR/SmtB family transcription factor [Microvirga puerhi]MBZ6076303.1 helix-turn-helix domain-containing protein [Microvirga puerhi]